MAASRTALCTRSPLLWRDRIALADSLLVPHLPQHHNRLPRHLSSSVRQCRQQQDGREPFGTRLRRALGETKIRWYPIPIGLGIGFLGLAQFYRINEREKARQREDEAEDAHVKTVGSGKGGEGRDSEGRPKKRQRIRPTGPWFVPEQSNFLCVQMLTMLKAGTDNVHSPFKSYFKDLGSIQ